jgi:hypothetical protein
VGVGDSVRSIRTDSSEKRGPLVTGTNYRYTVSASKIAKF